MIVVFEEIWPNIRIVTFLFFDNALTFLFSKAASEGGRQEDRKRKDGRQEEKGQSSKKGRNEATRPIHTNYKQPLLETLR